MRTPSWYALAIRCPTCGAEPAQRCKSKTRDRRGGPRRLLSYPHEKRLPDVWPTTLVDLRLRTTLGRTDARGPGIIGSHWIEPSPLSRRPLSAVTSSALPGEEPDAA